MNANEIFGNAISFEEAQKMRLEEYNNMLKIQNDIVLKKLPKIINDCRIYNKYEYKNLIPVHRYNTQLEQSLVEMGFTVSRPNPLPGAFNWHPDMDDNLYIRDDVLYAIQQREKREKKGKNVCNIL